MRLSAVKLDKWDLSIGITVGSWGLLQLSASLLVDKLDLGIWGIWGLAFLFSLFVAGLLLGAVLLLGSGIVLLVKAFQTSKLWGLAVLFIPFAAPVFIFKYWHQSWRPFLTSLLGAAVIVIAFAEVPRGN